MTYQPAAHPAPYPSGPGSPVTPPRRRRTGLVIGLVVAVVGLVAVVAVAGVAVVLRVDRPAETPSETVDAFLTAALTDKDIPRALTRVCAGHRSTIEAGLNRIDRVVRETGVTYSWTIGKAETHRRTASVTASWVVRSGSTPPSGSLRWFFELTIEDDAWKVCGWN